MEAALQSSMAPRTAGADGQVWPLPPREYRSAVPRRRSQSAAAAIEDARAWEGAYRLRLQPGRCRQQPALFALPRVVTRLHRSRSAI